MFKGNLGVLFYGGYYFRVRNCIVIAQPLQTNDVFIENSENIGNYPQIVILVSMVSKSCYALYPTAIFSPKIFSSSILFSKPSKTFSPQGNPTLCLSQYYLNQHYESTTTIPRWLSTGSCLSVIGCTFFNINSNYDSGGCLSIAIIGYVDIINSAFVRCWIVGAGYGGAAYLNVPNSTFLGCCFTECSAAEGWYGNAIYLAGWSHLLAESTIYSCREKTVFGTVYLPLEKEKDNALSLTTSNFTGCRAVEGSIYYLFDSKQSSTRYLTGVSCTGASCVRENNNAVHKLAIFVETKNEFSLFYSDSATVEVLVSDCLFKGNAGYLFSFQQISEAKIFRVINCKIIDESFQTSPDVFLEKAGNIENYPPILSLEPISSKSCNSTILLAF
jgi:hypothetical protein